MKKVSKLTVALATLIALPALSSCQKEVDDGTKIRIWTTFNDTYAGVIKSAIATFKAKYPEYKVQYTKASNDYSGLASDIIKGAAAGDYPDMTVVYPDSVANFIDIGISLNIKPYMESEELYPVVQVDENNKPIKDEEGNVITVEEPIGWTDDDWEDIPESYLEEGESYQVDGVYSVPFCKSTEALFYNRSILNNLNLSSIDDEINDGMPLDDDYLQNLTWEELFEKLCPALVEYNRRQPEDAKILKPSAKYEKTWAIVGYDSDDNWFISQAEQRGLGYTSIKDGTGSRDFVEKNADGTFKGVSDGWMSTIKYFNSAYQKGYFTTQSILGEYTSKCATTGGMLFSIGSTGGANNQFSETTKYDVGVGRLPQPASSDEFTVIGQGPSMTFLSRGTSQEIKDRRARGMWLLYKELTSTRWATDWCVTTNYAPIRNSVKKQPAYLALVNLADKKPNTLEILQARTISYVSSVIDDMFFSPVFVGSAKTRTAVKGLFSDIVKNKNKLPEPGEEDYESKMAKYEEMVGKYFKNAYQNSL